MSKFRHLLINALSASVPICAVDNGLLLYEGFDHITQREQLVDGVRGRAWHSDGQQYLSLGVAPSQVRSISLWIQPTSLTQQYARVLSCRSSWNVAEGFEIEVSPYTSAINCSGANASDKDQGIILVDYLRRLEHAPHLRRAPPNIIDPTWLHIVAVFEDNGLRFFVDGEERYFKKGVALPQDSSAPLLIGAQPTIDSHGKLKPSAFYTGSVDEIRLYDRPLTTEEVTELFPHVDVDFLKRQVMNQHTFAKKASARALEGFPVPAATVEEISAMALILDRYQTIIDKLAPDVEVDSYVNDLNQNGSWPDLDFASRARSRAPMGIHLDRCFAMLLKAVALVQGVSGGTMRTQYDALSPFISTMACAAPIGGWKKLACLKWL